MEIDIIWGKPLELTHGADPNLIYALDDGSLLPDDPGVYLFARKYGHQIIPLYIGRTKNLRSRVFQQLSNVKLMKGIENSPKGRRYLILGKLHAKPGQSEGKVLRIVESALIEHALSQGFDILNKQGKNRPTHSIRFTGNREMKRYIGNEVKARAIK